MWRRSLLLAPVPAVLALVAATGAFALPKPTRAQVVPHAFSSCQSLVGYAQSHLASSQGGLPEPPIETLNTATTFGAPTVRSSPATPSVSSAAATDGGAGGSTSFSTTNDQEAGVDEPDIVKTDGSTIFAIAQGKLQAVSVAGGAPHVVDTLDLGANLSGAELLLHGTRLIVISNPAFAYPGPIPVAADGASTALRASPYFLYGSQTILTEVDVSDPAAMKVTQTMTVDGRFVDARQAGSSARIVISSAPHAIVEPQLAGGASGWVPMWRFQDRRTGRRFTRQVAACGRVRRPVQFSGLGMLSIVTVDFAKGLGAAQSTSLMADAQIVYGSQTSLYLATQKWINPLLSVGQVPAGQETVIDKFDVSDPDATTFVSAGEVPG
ncbi:MAG TPA: beta-propeller domain-containing protein, partial [Gaiellaceae bacterium]|nr:beta-propeller domain-containing protein [Gaiellaceae bacterium]